MRSQKKVYLLAAIIPFSMISVALGIEPAGQQPEVPKDQKIAVILARKVLCKQPGKYIGWPSIAKAPNGDLLAVFSGDRTKHVSPDGKTQIVRSSDGAKPGASRLPLTICPSTTATPGLSKPRKGPCWLVGLRARLTEPSCRATT